MRTRRDKRDWRDARDHHDGHRGDWGHDLHGAAREATGTQQSEPFVSMRYRWRDAWKSEGHRYWEHREWEERLAHPYRRRLHEFGVPELPQAHPARRVTSSPSTSTADMPSLGLPAERAAQGTVLLVSDDLNALVALETLISEAGHSVMTATNRKDALEKAQCRQPDVVVSHMMMPMMDGSTLVSALSAAPQVPVSAFLKKPYAPEQLLALIGA